MSETCGCVGQGYITPIGQSLDQAPHSLGAARRASGDSLELTWTLYAYCFKFPHTLRAVTLSLFLSQSPFSWQKEKLEKEERGRLETMEEARMEMSMQRKSWTTFRLLQGSKVQSRRAFPSLPCKTVFCVVKFWSVQYWRKFYEHFREYCLPQQTVCVYSFFPWR